MKKLIIISALLLSACGATQQEADSSIAQVQAGLPKGCSLSYAGEVEVVNDFHASRIFVIQCGAVTTVSETHLVQQGKVQVPQTSVTVKVP